MAIAHPSDWRPGTSQWLIADALVKHELNRKKAFAVSIRPLVGSEPLVFASRSGALSHDEQCRRAWYRTGDVLKAIQTFGWSGIVPDDATPETVPSDPIPAPVAVKAPDTERLYHAVSPYVAKLVEANIPVWLHGPAGTGKSSAAQYAAELLGLDYFEVNLAGAMVSAIKGKDRLKEFVPSEFCRAYEFGGIICLEEFDAAHPTVATAINNAIAGDHFANDADGRTIPRHPDFRVIATANTLGTGATKEFNGRMKLDGATLDRFRIGRVFVGLDPKLEEAIFNGLRSGVNTATGKDLDRFYSEVKRLRTFTESRDSFDVLTSMRAVIDGCKAIKVGLPVEGLLASIGATWGGDSRAQAGIANYDYAGFKP